jgi:LacI family transcriptional regulator
LQKEELYLDLLVSKRVDGILLTKAVGSLSARTQSLLSSMKVPLVLMMRTCPELTEEAVVTDDAQAVYEAVSHLARIGHKSIAMVGGPLSISNGRTRLQGFKKALKASGLRFDPKLLYEGDYRIDSGHRAGLSLLPHRPDAVVVANFLMTVGLMQAAQEMGMRSPEDFGLITLDDYPWLRLFDPPLTAVELPKYEVGCLATELLIDRIEGKNRPAATHKIAPHLCVRESCGFGLRNGSSSLNLYPAMPALVSRGRRKARS